MMFPYPSAEGLHVGNCFAFIGADVYARYMKMQGYDVFEPMGFDAFGIHSENYALKVGEHPAVVTRRSIRNFKENQLSRLGNMFDWEHSINTTDPEYYRWTQWLFLQFFKHGLAERRPGWVNWCPDCKTVLADSQVEDGFCERHEETPVVRKRLTQWFLRITDFADRLLTNLDHLDWDEEVVKVQRNKIGKSAGAIVMFGLEDGTSLDIFTTRPDTLWGVTFVVLSPEHPAVEKLTSPEQAGQVAQYQQDTRRQAASRQSEEPAELSGVFTGAWAVNPATKSKVPVYIADFVLEDYATGAIMGVPAHDERDYRFARAFDLPIIEVIAPNGVTQGDQGYAYTGEGLMMNSGQFNGTSTSESVEPVTAWLEKEGLGRRSVSYALRDWCVSRQRYWCPPIPLVHCDNCGIVPVPEDELPVLLPITDDYIPDGSGRSPLARNEDWVRTPCPQCGRKARRETDGTDNFLDSAWYFLRYPSANCHDRFVDAGTTGTWLPVDMYIGGREHAFGHLLYFRFVTMALSDMGHIQFDEPCVRMRGHGILTKRVRPDDPNSPRKKISKKNGNIVNPEEYLDRYGADAFRIGLMSFAPFSRGGGFTDRAFIGAARFVERVWNLSMKGPNETQPDHVTRLMHRTVKTVGEDLASLRYNTAIAGLMTCLNGLQETDSRSPWILATLAGLIAPFAPFVAEELWEQLGHDGPDATVFKERWPTFDEALTVSDSVVVPVQVNGTVRATLRVEKGSTRGVLKEAAFCHANIRRHVAGKPIAKVIVVPDKVVSIVVGKQPPE